MAIELVWKIIIEGVSSQIAFNIIDINDPKAMWDILKRICSEVGQGVIYLVPQEILNYSRIHKPKRYDKPVVKIFTEVRFLHKRLNAVMTIRHNLFDKITIVIIFNILYSNFEVTTANMLKIGNKTIEEI